MSELPISVIRARLEQLGEIHLVESPRGVFCFVGPTPMYSEPRVTTDEAVRNLWGHLSNGWCYLHSALRHGCVAFWWDARIQDWGTSPNAPEGWPMEATDVEDIRMRLRALGTDLLDGFQSFETPGYTVTTLFHPTTPASQFRRARQWVRLQQMMGGK